MGGMEQIGAGGVSLPVQGIAWGVLAVLAWAVYNVGAKVGAAQGFSAPDLTVLRFGVAGLIMLPMLLRMGLRDLGGLGWPRGIALLLAAGPLFGLCVNTGFRNGPLGVKPLEQVSRRRVHASVRGRHDGRHTMPSGEEPTSQSLAAWFRPRGVGPPAVSRLRRFRVPATGPRGSRTVRSRSEAARFAPDDYASAASLPKRNSLPSTHRRCRRAESLRARATLARFMPRRLATSSAQRFRVENRPVLVSIACAAS